MQAGGAMALLMARVDTDTIRPHVEVAQHDVAAPPTHEADHVCVNTCHEEGHGAAGPHRSRADVFWRESHLGSHEGGCGAQCCGDFGTADGGPSSSVENGGKVCVWGGAVLLYMCNMAPDGRHCTCSGVSSCAVSDGLPFDAIFMRCKEEANKGGGGAGGG